MLGGSRLLTALLSVFIGAVALIYAKDSLAQDSTIPSGPPKAKVAPVEDTVQGHKIVDRYRYLENPNDPDTKLYVEEELAYTRCILDPLPGRDKIKARLSQLLEIGTLGAPQMGGKFYFHTRREGNQNQPILYIREGLNGGRPRAGRREHEVAATARLRWTGGSRPKTASTSPMEPPPADRKRARFTSSRARPAKCCPIPSSDTRFASVAWMKDSSAFYYTRHPKKGEVPDGEEVYHVKVFYHRLGSDPATTRSSSAKGAIRRTFPASLSPKTTAGC